MRDPSSNSYAPMCTFPGTGDEMRRAFNASYPAMTQTVETNAHRYHAGRNRTIEVVAHVSKLGRQRSCRDFRTHQTFVQP
jgi:acyl-coenzyme A thioesterase PaaI-like protein